MAVEAKPSAFESLIRYLPENVYFTHASLREWLDLYSQMFAPNNGLVVMRNGGARACAVLKTSRTHLAYLRRLSTLGYAWPYVSDNPQQHNSFLLATAVIGCKHDTRDGQPSLAATTDWMRQALKERNGIAWRDDHQPFANMTNDGCMLTYEPWQGDTIKVDLSDINPKTIAIKKIGSNPWVVFDTRDFHRSVKYHTVSETTGPPLDYSSPDGGFALNSDDVAQSFSKALGRAVQLCGGSASIF